MWSILLSVGLFLTGAEATREQGMYYPLKQGNACVGRLFIEPVQLLSTPATGDETAGFIG